MKACLVRLLAVSAALAFVTAAPSAHAQNAWSSGIQQGGELAAGQMRTWAFNLPAGNYLAFGRVSYVLRGGQDSGGLVCQLKWVNTNEFWDYEEVSITGDAQGGHTVEGEVTLMSQVTAPASGSIAVECRASGGQTGAQRIQDVRLELISVRSLNELTPIDTSGVRPPRQDPRNDPGRQRRQN